MPQSLQCPRCNGVVSVTDDAAGQRVRCPHCEQTFLAPGIAATTSDDDDWLTLDEPAAATSSPVAPKKAAPPPSDALPDPQPVSPPKKSPVPAPEKPSGPPAPGGKTSDSGKSSPALSDEDEALLAQFTDELDEFTAEIETPPAPLPKFPVAAKPPVKGAASPQRGPGPAKTNPGTPPAKPPAASGATPAPPAADVVEYAREFRVTCSICGSLVYAKAEDTGKTFKCNDCHSPVTIPPPPRVRKKPEIRIEESETFSFEQSAVTDRGPDPFKKSAEQLLEDASREETTNTNPTYDDVPSVKEWVKNVFGVFTDPSVLAHWAGLSIFAAIPAMLALKMAPPILILGLFPAGFFLGVLTVSCGFAIMNSVANEEDSVTDWPTFEPFTWIEQLLMVVAAAGVAAIPPWVVCHIVMGPNLLCLAITMLSIYVLFPFVLLSMLDMNSAFVPFSPEVARSVSKCQDAWGGFYFSAGLLFVGLFLTFAIASTMTPPMAAAISIPAGIGVAFCYFAMIGRLAYSIGQAVNAPPMKNDIDRSQRTDG